MACDQRIIVSPLTGKEVISKTWSDIRALTNTEEEADRLYQQLTSPAFLDWFGDWINDPSSASKVVNEHGEPLVVYHGGHNRSDSFNVGNGEFGAGIYFASHEAANNYLDIFGGDNIIPAFLSMKNPVYFDDSKGDKVRDNPIIKQKLTDSLGNDGIIYKSDLLKGNDLGVGEDFNDEYKVNNPNQIKSPFNQGTYDGSDNINASPQMEAYNEVLDEVIDEFFEGRPTFKRVAVDTVVITNSQKVKSNAQALAIANQKVKSIYEQTEGRVTGYVTQKEASAPIYIKLAVTERTIEERVQDNSLSFSPAYDASMAGVPNIPVVPVVGIYTNFVKQREDLLTMLKKRLARVINDKKKVTDENESIRLTKLENKLTDRIKGTEQVAGLEEEIENLKKNPEAKAVALYMERDLERLEYLAQSNDPYDVAEAKQIGHFIMSAGVFIKGENNPFFSEDDLFFANTGVIKKDRVAIQPFIDWADRASLLMNEVIARDQESIEQAFNANEKATTLWGHKTFKEITYSETGLKDSHWIDSWSMDVTQGTLSNNGMTPQVMWDIYSNKWEDKTRWSREIERRMNIAAPIAQKKMLELGYSLNGIGILGIKGVNWGSLFMQKTKDGYDTGLLTTRYSNEFFEARKRMEDEIARLHELGKNIADPDFRNEHNAKVHQEKKKWYLNNVIMLDVRKLPEVLSDQELSEFSHHFDIAGANDYKAKLIAVIGQTAYDEEVQKQIKQIKKYRIKEITHIKGILEAEGVATIDDLSDVHKRGINYWIRRNSPFYGVEDFFSQRGIAVGNSSTYNFNQFNITIPRKNKVNVKVENDKYTFESLTTPTDYWDTKFEEIEAHPELKEFHTLLSEVFKIIRDNMPPHIYDKMNVSSIPALKRGLLEILSTPQTHQTIKISKFHEASRYIYDRIKAGFGIVRQGQIDNKIIDPITGKANYEVNASFLEGNTRKIDNLVFLEKTRFMQLFNVNKTSDKKIKSMGRNTTIDISKLDDTKLADQAVIRAIAGYMHVAPTIKAITDRNGGSTQVNVSRAIKQSTTHTVVQQQSFDLPQIAKYFAVMAMEYAARNEVLPILSTMKDHYENIKAPRLNNVAQPLRKADVRNEDGTITEGKPGLGGLRIHAIEQMEDQFNRVILNNYDVQDFGVNKKKFYLKEEELLKSRIEAAIEAENKGEKNQETLDRLNLMLSQLGRSFSVGAAFDNVLKFTRLTKLGYNISAAITNFFDGWRENMALASTGDFFKPSLIYPAYDIVNNNFVLTSPLMNSITAFVSNKIGGTKITAADLRTDEANKVVLLMEKYRVLQDSSNELQKSSVKTNFSKLRNLSPFELIRRVEFVNQSPLMIAMLMDIQIMDDAGNRSSVWDAMDRDGNLKAPFNTEENRQNWEQNGGTQYNSFKTKLAKAIVLAHGNYDDKRGMRIKSHSVGKAAAMFKTWLPMAIHTRYAREHDDMARGETGVKGRFLSFTPGSAALSGAITGFTVANLPGAIVGFGLGIALSKYRGSKAIDKLAGRNTTATAIAQTMANYGGARTELGFAMDLAYSIKALAKKMLGMPLNTIMGSNIINSDEDFNEFIGETKDGKFTARDAKNMRANISSMSIVLSLIILTLLAKLSFYDDDNETPEEKSDRLIHNLLVNRFIQLTSQITAFSDPSAFYKQVTDLGLIKFVDQVITLLKDTNEALKGNDELQSGPNKGDSRLGNDLKKTIVPSMLREVPDMFSKGEAPKFGFGSQGDRQFIPQGYDSWFYGKEKDSEKEIKKLRTRATLEFMEENPDATEKQLNKFLKKQGLGPRKKKQSFEDKLKEIEEE